MKTKNQIISELFNKNTNAIEKEITENAIDIAKKIHLSNECINACYLYYPYVKTAIYTKPDNFDDLDENQKKIEDQKKEGLNEERLKFKQFLSNNFGEDLLQFLHGLKKLLEIDYSNEEKEAENIRKMFFAITKDIRIIIVKLCFVLAEIRQCKSSFNIENFRSNFNLSNIEIVNNQNIIDSNKIQENTSIVLKAKQIMQLFAPLAARLGLSSIKSELEDIAFQILNNKKYNEIKDLVDNRYLEREKTVADLKNQIKSFLNELGIKGEVMGRKKHIYSIYKKLKEKNNNIDKIYDLVAVRAILKTVADCYALLGKINEKFTPLQNRFKDYISIPKSNGYQSLHTTIMFEGVPVEIQIRTISMHRHAEFGVAAHWVYKEKRSETDSLDKKLGWIREIMENGKDMSNEELINMLKVDIYDGEIFVQTPKGKVLHLPKDSTAIDFAYMIHTDIGNKCIGAKINGKMQPLTKVLQNGDIVEIITNVNSKGPSRDWLKIVKSSQAKSKILSFFKKEMKEDNIKNGKIMFEQAIKNLGYSVNKLLEKKYTDLLLNKYNFTSIEELYASIGCGAYSAKMFAGKLIQTYQMYIKKEQDEIQTSHIETIIYNNDEKKINVKGLNNILVKFAKCCCPIEGDEIIGFISQGRGIIVHRKQCPNVNFFDKERLIDVEWNIKKS